MRLPYAPEAPPTSSHVQTKQAYKQLSERRAPNPLQALDLTLLHAPPVAAGWSSFLGAVRTQTSLAADIREICICRVARLNGADYEWEHHLPILRSEGGLGERAIKELTAGRPQNSENGAGQVMEKGLSEAQWAVVDYADSMTRHVQVPADIFAKLKQWFGKQEIVEITATIAAYNCVSRFLVALDVGEMNQQDPMQPVEKNGPPEREGSAEIEDAWLRGAEMGIWE
ncbi:hypothetical protein G7Y79_00001g001840 [Physcia stellaris]|nr:hypothetical protein G7Y79_00001g001840 [Physcia stellaris]